MSQTTPNEPTEDNVKPTDEQLYAEWQSLQPAARPAGKVEDELEQLLRDSLWDGWNARNGNGLIEDPIAKLKFALNAYFDARFEAALEEDPMRKYPQGVVFEDGFDEGWDLHGNTARKAWYAADGGQDE